MISANFAGRVGLQQRVIPSYRAPFIDALANACLGGLSVFAGEPLPIEGIDPVESLKNARYVHARNHYFRNPTSSMFLFWQAGFIPWLEDWQPEILIVEANPRYLATRQAISWMHRRSRKVVGWGLGAPSISGPLARLRQWERTTFLRSLDAVAAYSRLGAEQYRALGLPPGSVFVAPNAVSPAPLYPPPNRPVNFNGKPVVLFVGRLQSRKRVDLLLQACAALPLELQPAVVIVGDGPARLEFESIASQVYPAAQFAGSHHGAELEPFYQQADLFVLPGTGGLAIQQAMAHALPVIVARGDGTQDDLVSTENGWQVPQDDLQALTVTLQAALSDPVNLRRMGAASFRIVSEEINIEKMVESFIQAMSDLDK